MSSEKRCLGDEIRAAAREYPEEVHRFPAAARTYSR
jgi:hypothetical protein